MSVSTVRVGTEIVDCRGMVLLRGYLSESIRWQYKPDGKSLADPDLSEQIG